MDSEPIFSAPALVVQMHTLQSTVLYFKTEKLSKYIKERSDLFHTTYPRDLVILFYNDRALLWSKDDAESTSYTLL